MQVRILSGVLPDSLEGGAQWWATGFEHRARVVPEGSTPSPSAWPGQARVAQWESTGPTNRVVAGSSPAMGTQALMWREALPVKQ